MKINSKSTILTVQQQQYKDELRKKIERDNGSFESFTKEVESILLKDYGVKDWSLSNLELPRIESTANYIGTVNRDFVEEYTAEKLFNGDMIAQHVSVSDIPIYQSDIEACIDNLNILTNDLTTQKKIIKRNKSIGYLDTFNIPIRSSINGNRFLLSLTSLGGHPKQFKKWTSGRVDSLKILALAVIDCGIKRYPDTFVDNVEKHKSIANSQPMKLLKLLAQGDYKIGEAAEKFGISESTATKHLKTAREVLGVKTNLKAFEVAQELGYVK